MSKSLFLDPRRGLPSASIMGRLDRCPGSLWLSNAVKRKGYFVPQNPYAESGTRIHQLLAGNLRDGLSSSELETASQCQALAEEVIIDWTVQDPSPMVAEHIIERRLWYKTLEETRVFSGQPDIVFIKAREHRALILNYKSGRTEADPVSDNLQLRAETVLVKRNWPELEQIQAAIIEPWVSWESERVTYEGEAFEKAEEQILSICDAALFRSKERNAGPWCQYCPGRVYCQEAMDYVQRLPNFPAQNGEKLDKDTGESLATFDHAMMFRDLPRGERGAELFRRLKFAQKLLKNITETYEKILETEPQALPGFILPERGRARQIVPLPAKLKAALADFLSSDEIDGCATFWPGKVKELFGMKQHLEGKELHRQFALLTQGTIEVLHDRPFIRELTKKEKAAARAVLT